MNAIEFKNVSLSYGKDNKVLDNISFEIKEGEFVSLIGANGAGKSSIAKLIINLIEPRKGSIKVFDIDVNQKNAAKVRYFTGYVFQNPDNQFVGNTVADDVAFRLENNCIPQKDMDSIIDKTLNEVGMIDYKNYEPQLLSGGQKQRIAIASNLVTDLKVIIFDESTSMIDPEGRQEVIQNILKIKKNNPQLTILYITHNMEEVLFTDRTLVLNNHKIAYDGKPEDLFINTKKLEEFNLKAPFKYEFFNKLKSNGYDINLSDNIEEISKKICQ